MTVINPLFYRTTQEANIDTTAYTDQLVKGIRIWYVANKLEKLSDHRNVICGIEVKNVVNQNKALI